MKKSTCEAIKKEIFKQATASGFKPTRRMYRSAKKFYLQSDGKMRSLIRG